MQYFFRIGARKDSGARFDGLGALGYVANDHIWHFQDRRLFLNGSAIGKDRKRVLFQLHKVVEAHRSYKAHERGLGSQIESLNLVRRSWVQAGDHRTPEMFGDQVEPGK